MAGFHTEGGGLEFPPQPQFPPPRNLEVEYGHYCGTINISYLIYMLLDISMNYQKVCPRLRQKQSERFYIFLAGGGRGTCPQTPLVGTHAYMCVSVLSHATIILVLSCFLPPNSKSCMKPCTGSCL